MANKTEGKIELVFEEVKNHGLMPVLVYKEGAVRKDSRVIYSPQEIVEREGKRFVVQHYGADEKYEAECPQDWNPYHKLEDGAR